MTEYLEIDHTVQIAWATPEDLSNSKILAVCRGEWQSVVEVALDSYETELHALDAALKRMGEKTGESWERVARAVLEPVEN